MAGDWIKIEHGLPSKPEVLELADLLGIGDNEAVGLLVRFWIWVDENLSRACPVVRGTKRGLDRVVRCDGFATALEKVGWLSIEGDVVSIPNYDHHLSQSGKQRALAARKKQRQRENLSRFCPPSKGTKGGPEKRREEKRREEERREEERRGEETTLGSASAEPCRAEPDPSKPRTPTADINAVVEHYREFHPKACPGTKERHLVALRLQDGYSVEDLCRAIDGCHVTPHNLGANDRDTPYLSLELILRNSSQVTRFLENAANPPKSRNEKERRTLDAAAAWIERVSG
ncbi:MAG TPA: hypothetical protein VNA25_21610 [Phycisphaerae bacterium]|nr:hypothetical protein [Phycisphaerae bacterium]